eukprot:CAMPEP_0206033142 /NCGR_PEP_ID=MMETSP1466-20131121/430_1 /ASSEMBLY_ACC=CAM_ASM_001126 /TAXON_ID=44452 /ORGANISM="Pavlova gyrans, Strain CCMP608" /LENGTH=38 /DNA_ID= /DNA_START= /DNA_END= /DNA_ORIENTATION=
MIRLEAANSQPRSAIGLAAGVIGQRVALVSAQVVINSK